jgi:hypothetical protein
MGSDDGNKRGIYSTSTLLYTSATGAMLWIKTGIDARLHKKKTIYIFVCITLTIITIHLLRHNNTGVIKLFRIYVSPEYHLTKTFQRVTNTDYEYLPAHCRGLAKHFDACQNRQLEQHQQIIRYQGKRRRSYNDITPIIVFACHRKWCHTYFGHCELCFGISDRYRFLLSQMDTIFSTTLNEKYDKGNHPNQKMRTSTDGFTCYANVQIDAPINGLQQIESSLYTDPGMWFSEFFHYRSYSVSKQELLPYNNILLQQSQPRQRQRYYYTHFIPRHYVFTNDYNACYFHIIYKPDDQLQREIEYHRNTILHSRLSSYAVDEQQSTVDTIIGIVYYNDDSKSLLDDPNAASRQISGWNQMYACTISFMKQLIFQDDDYSKVRLLLATNSTTVIDHVRQHYVYDRNTSLSTSASEFPFIPVYVMNLKNDSNVRGGRNDDERSTLLELYLLSSCNAIIVSSVAASNGTIPPVIPLATLAKKIGFVPNSNFYKCSIH